jgi:hypothetical protein
VTGEALRRRLTARLTPAFTCDARLVMGGALRRQLTARLTPAFTCDARIHLCPGPHNHDGWGPATPADHARDAAEAEGAARAPESAQMLEPHRRPDEGRSSDGPATPAYRVSLQPAYS